MKPKILVVDDEKEARTLIIKILSRDGYDFVEATNGIEALMMLELKDIDLIILDLVMPDMDGFSVLEQKRSDISTRNVPVIISSALSDLKDIERGLQLGAMDYFIKPLTGADIRFQLPLKVRNLIQWKRLQEELLESAKMATVGRLSAGLTHEFNNMLCTILGNVDIALLKRDPAQMEKALSIVKKVGERMTKILQSLSSFARKIENVPKSVMLPEVLEAVLSLLSIDLSSHHIEVHKSFAAISPVYADPKQMQLVFLHLLINARDAMEEGGTLSLEVTQEGNTVTVSVTDTGHGIPEKDLKKIFDPFYTTKGALGGSPLPGIGLGLSLCYGIIANHRGTIEVSSRLGEGSTFRVKLPIDRRDV